MTLNFGFSLCHNKNAAVVSQFRYRNQIEFNKADEPNLEILVSVVVVPDDN